MVSNRKGDEEQRSVEKRELSTTMASNHCLRVKRSLQKTSQTATTTQRTKNLNPTPPCPAESLIGRGQRSPLPSLTVIIPPTTSVSFCLCCNSAGTISVTTAVNEQIKTQVKGHSQCALLQTIDLNPAMRKSGSNMSLLARSLSLSVLLECDIVLQSLTHH